MRTFLALVVLVAAAGWPPVLPAQSDSIPDGFTPIFNGSNIRSRHGMIAVQGIHGGERWIEGGYQRFRNIAVKELN